MNETEEAVGQKYEEEKTAREQENVKVQPIHKKD